MNTADFLRLVLPSQGYYFLATPSQYGGYNHKAFQDVDTLAKAAQIVSGKGVNAFFACSCFEQPEYVGEDGKKHWRTGDNATHAKAQWIDIDCGNDEYPTQKDGLIALKQFCNTTKLRWPNAVVNSGNGIHAYWVFDEEVPKEQWRKVAKVFKGIMAAVRFAQTDTSRTADIASVLRPIGTNNDKTHKGRGIKPVKLIGEIDHNLWSFRSWVSEIRRLQQEFSVREPKEKSDKPSRNADLLGGTEHPPADANRIADRCQQMRAMRNALGEGQEEPLWYDCLGILAYCEGGEELAIEWSSGHEGFSKRQTVIKLHQRKTGAGPTTCERFNSTNPEGCAGCPKMGKISSPILLGAPEPEHETEVVTEDEEGEQVVEQIPDLPESIKKNFVWKKEQLHARKKTAEGDEWVPFCAQLPIPQYTYFCHDDKAWKLRMKVRIRPQVWREADINARVVSQGGTALLGEMGAKLGVYPRGTGVDMVNYMRTWADEIQRNSDEVTAHSHIGWYEDGSFVLGNVKYLPNGCTKVVRLTEALEPYVEGFTPQGDLTRYCELINLAYNRPKHQMYQWTWLASFASPLLRLVTRAPIGIPLMAWSTESGFGKTTAALSGISVWGNPYAPNQVANANKVTEYALYVMAGQRRDIPILLDEATMWEPMKLANFAYNYSDGRPKIQGQAAGGLRDNSDVEWSNFIYVNANNSAVDAMSNTIVNSAPMIARVWEYQFTLGHGDTLSMAEGSRVFDELKQHWGVAGDAYLRYIVPRQNQIRDQIFKVRDKFESMASVSKDARNWLLAAAVVWVAYGLTKKLNMQQFDGDALKKWIVDHLTGMNRSAKDSKREMTDVFADMMSDLQSGFIVTVKEGDKRANIIAQFATGYGPPRGAVTGRVILDDKRAYLSQNVVRRWCSDNNVPYKELKLALEAKGWITRVNYPYYLGKGTSVALPVTTTIQLDISAFETHLKLVPEVGSGKAANA